MREIGDDGAIAVMQTSTVASASLSVVLIAFISKAGSSPAFHCWDSGAVSVNSMSRITSFGWAIVCIARSSLAFREFGRKAATVSVAVARATEPMIMKSFVFMVRMI